MIRRFRTTRASEPQAVTIDAAAIVRRARRLRFRIRPGAVADFSGAYLGARPGIGLTFAEIRAYQPGDDVRHLDWNVTARQGRPYLRRYVEERSLTLWLIVDVSASLGFGPQGETKADRAAQAAALLATAAIQNGDRAGLIMVSDRVELEIPPGGGDSHLAQLIRALVATPTSSRKTDLDAGLARLRGSNRRTLVVVLSDFLTPQPLSTGLWRKAAKRHQMLGLRVVEPREESLPDVGVINLRDSESGSTRLIDSSDRAQREAYAKAAAERRATFRLWCAGTGIEGHEISTTSDPIGPLTRIFQARSKNRRPL